MTDVAIVPCCPNRSGAAQRARTTVVAIVAAAQNGTSDELAERKHIRRRAGFATPRNRR